MASSSHTKSNSHQRSKGVWDDAAEQMSTPSNRSQKKRNHSDDSQPHQLAENYELLSTPEQQVEMTSTPDQKNGGGDINSGIEATRTQQTLPNEPTDISTIFSSPRLRERIKPVQYMPPQVSRVSKASRLPLAEREEASYLADIPSYIPPRERKTAVEQLPQYLIHSPSHPNVTDGDVFDTYIRRALARLLLLRSCPPRTSGIQVDMTSSDDDSQDDTTLNDDYNSNKPESAGFDDRTGSRISSRRKRQVAADWAKKKRTRAETGLSGAVNPLDISQLPVCEGESKELMFVDGALVLLHPNVHEIFMEMLNKSGKSVEQALKSIDSSVSSLFTIWTQQEQIMFSNMSAKHGENLEGLYRDLAPYLYNKSRKNVIDYFYRCVNVALEMEELYPDLKNSTSETNLMPSRKSSSNLDQYKKSLSRASSSNSLEASLSAEASAASEGRMTTRGRVTIPSWQRSDMYELKASSDTSDSDPVGTPTFASEKLRALEFIKRARMLLDNFCFSQLMNALMMLENSHLSPLEVIIRVRQLCSLIDDSSLIRITRGPGHQVLKDFLGFLPINIRSWLLTIHEKRAAQLEVGTLTGNSRVLTATSTIFNTTAWFENSEFEPEIPYSRGEILSIPSVPLTSNSSLVAAPFKANKMLQTKS